MCFLKISPKILKIFFAKKSSDLKKKKIVIFYGTFGLQEKKKN